MGDITSQVRDLVSNNHQLLKQIETITNSLNDLHEKSYATAVQTSNLLPPSSQNTSEGSSTHSSSSQAQPPTPVELRDAVSSVINEEKEKTKEEIEPDCS